MKVDVYVIPVKRAVVAFAIGDTVALTKDGAEFGREGTSIVTEFPRTDEVAFFAEGIVGVVRDERYDRVTGNTEYAVAFADDPVEGREWFVCYDEITVAERKESVA